MIKLIMALILSLSFSGCAPSSQNNETLLKINNYSMSSAEVTNELKSISTLERSGKTNEELLERIIEKKLLLQEAQREGLDKAAPFMKMIERFWEQSLLRAIIEKKMEEFLASACVSEEEISSRAAKLDQKLEDVKTIIIREKIEKRFEEWIRSLKCRSKIYVDKKALEKIRIPAGEE
jgi:hypothetical protein